MYHYENSKKTKNDKKERKGGGGGWGEQAGVMGGWEVALTMCNLLMVYK